MKRNNYKVFLLAALCLSSASWATIIHGVVNSGVDNSNLGQVKVSSDATHSTLTAVDGSFTLNTEKATATILTPAQREDFAVNWHSGQGYFSWSQTSEKISIDVKDPQGARVAHFSQAQCCPEGRFYPKSLPAGVYFISFHLPGKTVNGKFLNLRSGGASYLFSGITQDDNTSGAASRGLRKSSVTAAATIDTLTFAKDGYSTLVKVVPDSLNNIVVPLYPPSKIKTVFVVAMENTDASSIYGNTANASYINDSLMTMGARASAFVDELPIAIISEPHYIWMEAGTNVFSDRTFSDDADASATVSTAVTDHLVTQLRNTANGNDWMAYQEGINSSSGACPISSSGFYAAKHDPFVFFRDVSGSPPSKTNVYCAAHHKEIANLFTDLAAKTVSGYNFVTPNQCHDMHGQSGCPNSNNIQSGDNWLRANLPALIQYVNENAGVIFLTWDEGGSTAYLPFVAIGPGVKKGYVSSVTYNHSSQLKSIERILQVPTLSKVSAAADFSDLFTAGQFP